MTYLTGALVLAAVPIAFAAPAAAQTASPKAELLKDWVELKDTTRHIAIRNAASCPEDAVTLVTLTRSQSSFHRVSVTVHKLADAMPEDKYSFKTTGPSSRARVIYFLLGHTWDIDGQMVVYLRLNGGVPPASQRP